MVKKKKHAPIEQLRETAKVAESILRDRSIHTKESAIEQIEGQRQIMLPGIPPYLPHRWTLAAARKILANLVIIWVEKTRGDKKRQEDHREFFRFLLEEMAKIEQRSQNEVNKMPPFIKALRGTVLLHKIFKPMQEVETTHSMTQFLVDAFAVAVVLKEHETVADFVYWFDDWTRAMDRYWAKREQKDVKIQ